MKILDFIGIGFGPANISLAIQLQENNLYSGLTYKFIESEKDSFWQREMMITGSDIQNIPFRDLITPIDPQSHYSFINYLHKTGKYFKYFNTGLKYPLRKEYAMYISWCADHFKEFVHYQETVISIEVSECKKYYILCTTVATYYAKTIIFATGRNLYMPKVFKSIPATRLITINNFVSKTKSLNRDKKYRFAICGASQSAAEIFLELSNKFYNATIHSYIRKFSFAMKDLSPFSYEIYFPEFIDEYYYADDNAKALLNSHLRRTNYSSVDMDVLEQINLKIYEENLEDNFRLKIHRNSEIVDVECINNNVLLKSINNVTNHESSHEYDFIIVCTGFKDLGNEENKDFLPPLLNRFIDKVVMLNETPGSIRYISPNYELFLKEVTFPIYLNGLCETSHGMGDAGSFSLISIRTKKILDSLLNILNKR